MSSMDPRRIACWMDGWKVHDQRPELLVSLGADLITALASMAPRYFSATRIVLSSEATAADMYKSPSLAAVDSAPPKPWLHPIRLKGDVPSDLPGEQFSSMVPHHGTCTLPAGPHLQLPSLAQSCRYSADAMIHSIATQDGAPQSGARIERQSSAVK